ncbi:MAG: MmcQ/YjbR family DNA-binding protein [Hyphomicrobiales bacterium]
MAVPESLDDQRERVRAIATALPEAQGSSRTGQHLKFDVRGKTFLYFLVDHHGDGRVAINVKAPPGAQQALVARDPERYFVPAYLGPRGWVGIDLGGANDWDEIEAFIRESYRLAAPKRLAGLVSP